MFHSPQPSAVACLTGRPLPQYFSAIQQTRIRAPDQTRPGHTMLKYYRVPTNYLVMTLVVPWFSSKLCQPTTTTTQPQTNEPTFLPSFPSFLSFFSSFFLCVALRGRRSAVGRRRSALQATEVAAGLPPLTTNDNRQQRRRLNSSLFTVRRSLTVTVD